MTNTYNGWTNWETWLTNLHIFDGQTAEELGFPEGITADDCEAYVQEILDMEESKPSFFVADILGGFMSTVDWGQIARHLNEEIAE